MSCASEQYAERRHDIALLIGEQYKLEVENIDSEEAVVDLTGYDAKMQVRVTVGDEDLIETYTVGSGITITAEDGLIEVLIDSDGWDPGTYIWDLWITNPSGEKEAIVWGSITAREAATKFA